MYLSEAAMLLGLQDNYSEEEIEAARNRILGSYCPDAGNYPYAANEFTKKVDAAARALKTSCSKRVTIERGGQTMLGGALFDAEYDRYWRRKSTWQSTVEDERYLELCNRANVTASEEEHAEVAERFSSMGGYKDSDALYLKHSLISADISKQKEIASDRLTLIGSVLSCVAVVMGSVAFLLMTTLPYGLNLDIALTVSGAFAIAGLIMLSSDLRQGAAECIIFFTLIFAFAYLSNYFGNFSSEQTLLYEPIRRLACAIMASMVIGGIGGLVAERHKQANIIVPIAAFVVLAIAGVMYFTTIAPHIDEASASGQDAQKTAAAEAVSLQSSGSHESEEHESDQPNLLTDDVVNWEDASKYVGCQVKIHGPVVGTLYSPETNGQPTYLDIGEGYPSDKKVTAVIWLEDAAAFPSDFVSLYDGKNVIIEGGSIFIMAACT